MQDAEVFLAALGRHGVIDDWWSGVRLMAEDARARGPNGEWTKMPTWTPFEVKTGTQLLIDPISYLLLPGSALKADVDMYITVGAIVETDGGYDIELAIRPNAPDGRDANLHLVTYGRDESAPASRVKLEASGGLKPLQLRVSNSAFGWLFATEHSFSMAFWEQGARGGYTGDQDWHRKMVEKRKELETRAETLEAHLPEAPPGAWDISVTTGGPDPVKLEIHSEGSFATERDGSKRLHVFQGLVDVTHLNNGKQLAVPGGQSYETSPAQPVGTIEPFDPADVPRWWERESDAPPGDEPPAQPEGDPQWTFDGSGAWSTDEGGLIMTGTGAFEKRWALLDRERGDFTFEVDVRKLTGDSDEKTYPFGLLVRADESGRNSYELSITTGGKFRITRRTDGKVKALTQFEKTSALQEGGRAWNTIKVVSKGDQLAFYANDEHLINLETAAEGAYKRGRVGIFAVDGRGQHPDMVEFREFSLTTPN